MKKLLGTILKSVIFFMVWSIMFIPYLKFNNDAYERLWLEFEPFAAIIILSVIFVYIVEKGKVRIPFVLRFPRNFLIGIVVGILWLGIVVVVLIITGTMKIQGQNNIDHIFIWFLASLLNVAMQEYLARGYLYQLWKRKYNAIVATALTTALFAFMHGGAFEAGVLPVLNVISMSVFITLLLEYTGTILAPILAHFIWNTAGGIIIGGVSLASDYPHLLNSTFQGNPLISGGTYEIEGSIVVLVVNLILILVFLVLNKSKSIISMGAGKLPQ